MKSRKSLTDIRLNTLLLLNAKPRHGYELIKDLEAFTGKRISSGQVYPLLKDLQKSGLVKITSRGRREKKTFSMTADGRRTVSNAISKIGGLLDSFVSSKVKSCAHCGCEVYRGGCKTIIGRRLMYFCCANCADAYRRRGS